MTGRIDLDELERLAARERATVVLDLIAELRGAYAKLAAIQRLLEASPIGPTRAQAVATLFEIRLVATDEFDQPTQTEADP